MDVLSSYLFFNFCHTMSTTKTDENVSLVTHAIAYVASVSNRVIARKLERKQKKHFFLLSFQLSRRTSRGNTCYTGYAIRFGTSGVCHNSATITRLCYLTNQHWKGLTMNSEEWSFMPKNSERNSVRWHSNQHAIKKNFSSKRFVACCSRDSMKFMRLLWVVFSSQQRCYWGINNDLK